MYWILASVSLTTLFYFYLIKPFTYWTRKDIPQKSIIKQWKDTLRVILQLEPQPELNRICYNDFPDKRCHGGYQFLSPVLYLRDPDLIKQITVKDFDHFMDHNEFFPEDIEPLVGKNLFALKGDKWRDMRSILSPIFTSSKMRAMFTLMNECALQFVSHFNADKTKNSVNMKDAFTRFANDVIATTAFGVKCDSLENPNNEFYLMGKEVTNMRGLWRNLSMLALITAPKLCNALGIRMFSIKVGDFFKKLVKTNIESREQNGIVRPDMIQLLMEAKNGRLKHENQSSVLDSGFAVIEESFVGKQEMRQKYQLTNDDLTAQALVFFFAGFENVSTLMCFLIYELAVNSEMQESLREEVDETLKKVDGLLTYESLLKMKYMDMVVSETLRKWPTVTGVDRVCVKPYTIYPSKNGEVPIHIEKGDIIWLPIYAIHRNSQFYPNPEQFDPERFSDENKRSINPYAYIPFGAGPRSCIANRFALLETKTVVFHILANFEIKVTETTTIPLELAKDQFNITSASGFWFRLIPRKV